MNATIAEGISSAGEKLRLKDKKEEGNNIVSEQSANLGCAILTCAKWCPLENCTILVLGELYYRL